MDLFSVGDIVHAAFDVKQYRGGVGSDIVILKYSPVCLIEAVCSCSEAPSGQTCTTLVVVGLSVQMRGLYAGSIWAEEC